MLSMAIAKEAIKRNTGARGLRAILEQSMLEVMYELPAKHQRQEVHRHQERDRSRVNVPSW